MRALWERTWEELETLPRAARPLAARAFANLREWDYITAARVDLFIANSQTTRERIERHYRRESRIIYPAIDTVRFAYDPTATVGDYYLVASRLVPYKRVDLAIAATAQLKRKLVLVGTGPDKKHAGNDHVEYLGHVPEDRLIALMRGAKALIFPGFEDFGMTPVEMMACGRPVIAYGKGGALETVVDGTSGVFAGEQSVDAFVDAIVRSEAIEFDSARIAEHAQASSFARFEQAMLEAVADVVHGRI
jgi:glycosyltransferase involved in cell wall biosynthesis